MRGYTRYRINYNQTKRQVREIKTYVYELETYIRNIEETRWRCNNIWKGQAADVFDKKLEYFSSEVKRTKREIDNISDLIMNIANRIQREDEENARRLNSMKR